MSDRRVDVFFYGLFMDADKLRKADIEPAEPRRAQVAGFALRIGQRATLVPSDGSRAYGMLYALTHRDLERLYAAAGLEQYHAEAVLAEIPGGGTAPALCYNLSEAPAPEERNADYASRLRQVLEKLNFPADYIASIG